MQGIDGRRFFAPVEPLWIPPIAFDRAAVFLVCIVVPIFLALAATVHVRRGQTLMGDPVGRKKSGHNQQNSGHKRTERLPGRLANQPHANRGQKRQGRQFVCRRKSGEQPGDEEIAQPSLIIEQYPNHGVNRYSHTNCAGQVVVEHDGKRRQKRSESGGPHNKKPPPVRRAQSLYKTRQKQHGNRQGNHVHRDQHETVDDIRMRRQRGTRQPVDEPVWTRNQGGKQRRLARIQMPVVFDHVDRVPIRQDCNFIDRVGSTLDAHVLFHQSPHRTPAATVVCA